MSTETDALGTPKPPFRWSFSQWENYDTCPQRWKFKSILKYPGSPPGPAAARGLSLHDRCDQYISGRITQEELTHGTPADRFGEKKPAVIHPKFIPILDAYRNHENGDRGSEAKLAFDAEWAVCAPKSKFAACIMVLDAHRFGGPQGRTRKFGATDDIPVDYDKTIRIAEWKSGKPKDRHADQRKLYALGGLLHWSTAARAEVTTYYLEDTAPPVRLTVKFQELDKLKTVWQRRIDLMQRDEMCAPRPGTHCNWCDYAKSKGGPCQFGG